MIIVRDVVTSILYVLGENATRKHSDPEIIDAMNLVLRYVNLSLINAKSYWITKEKKLNPVKGMAKLPDDFGGFKSFDKFDGEYKFIRGSVKIGSPVTMLYLYTLPPIESIEDEIDLPYLLYDIFVRFTAGLLNGNFSADTVSGLITAEVNKLAQTESAGPIDRPVQFFV